MPCPQKRLINGKYICNTHNRLIMTLKFINSAYVDLDYCINQISGFILRYVVCVSWLSVCPIVCLSVCLCVCVYVRLYVRPSVCLYVRPSVCLSVCLSLWAFTSNSKGRAGVGVNALTPFLQRNRDNKLIFSV